MDLDDESQIKIEKFPESKKMQWIAAWIDVDKKEKLVIGKW